MHQIANDPVLKGIAYCNGMGYLTTAYIDAVAVDPCLGRMEHTVFAGHLEVSTATVVLEVYPLFRTVESHNGGVALELYR